MAAGRDADAAFLAGLAAAGRDALPDFDSVAFLAGVLAGGFAGVALRTGGFAAVAGRFAACFGRADFVVSLLPFDVDFVTVLYEAGREASLLALFAT